MTQPALAPAVEGWMIEELRARIARLALRLDDVERFVPLGPTHLDPGRDDASSLRTVDGDVEQHADLTDWVETSFAAVYVRPLGGQWRWCPRWNEHPEAAERLDALWRTWQDAQHHPPLGMATWLRDHLDHQLPILIGPAGPFAGCSPERHEPHRALPVIRTDSRITGTA